MRHEQADTVRNGRVEFLELIFQARDDHSAESLGEIHR